ncbi:catechol 2,3-dioxygenase [Sphingobium phenoxybenzoativorans]|uniref:Metapyrocatechase n=1 Tax=Sphingobium phenoxybenzoativorans TaxID=1592790 RepID=A0A1W5YR16_9SPHN|nr:catechol 2,3-dioxygenase [Sphingobium phenoxybenzoativorans]ARI47611.1 catechol 2,3-dioxygenase [Sphingobium phenoxybenzoativorans]
MALTGVLRPGYVQVRVLDMEASLVHYRDRIGLDLVEMGADGRAYLKAPDEFDHHSIILREADEPGMDFMGFKVSSDEVLTALGRSLSDSGLSVEEVAAGEQPGLGRRLSFFAPTGHRFELFSSMELSSKGPMIENPDLWHDEPRGMKAQRFDHCLVYGIDIDATARIFVDLLGFQVAEKAVTPDGDTIAIFLSCGMKAHDLALVRFGEDAKLHHVSFRLESWHDIGHAADLMTRYDMSVDIGPTRHGITRGQTIYFFDPSGNRNEVFSGGYDFYPDNPVRQWTADQAGKAIFYYERALNDRFMTVVT